MAAEAVATNASMVEVAFRVEAELCFGEEVRVCGSAPAIGCNDPSRAVPLVTSSALYPMWTTKDLVFLPGGAGSVSYRYCVFSGGRFLRWEGKGKEAIVRALWQDKPELSSKSHDVLDVPPVDDMAQQELSHTASYRSTSQAKSQKARRFDAWSRKQQLDQSMSSQDNVIIVSYFLPVILSRSALGQWSAIWDEENLLALQTNMRITWVGSVRYFGAIPVEEEDRVSAALLELNCHPVFINQTMHYKFYDIFCKQNLWPVLHHIADVYGPINQNDFGAKAQQDLWFTYTTVNRLFRDKVVEVYQNGHLIWIHGFHLMLLPSFLRRTLHFSKIGYFFHTPFPSSEIWRTLTRREDLLRGILAADQVGFHLYEYARHFLSTCRRLLGHSNEISVSGGLTISVDNREVAITCIHVGVEMSYVDKALADPKFIVESAAWKARFPNKVIMAGIPRMERLRGAPLTLMAIEKFMEEQAEWRGKVVFLIIGISAKERGDDYRQTQTDVRIVVDRINRRFADPSVPSDVVVHFEERAEIDMRLPHRLAFLSVADVLLIGSIREGLNRTPMEFTLARAKGGQHLAATHSPVHGAGLFSEGLIIISEFVSSARVMRGGLTVNPWNVSEVKGLFQRVLEMGPAERADRMRRNLEFSTRLTTVKWATQVLYDLKCVEKSEDISAYSGVGFGLGFRVMGVKTGFQQLNIVALNKAYRAASHRLILLDWGGTLVAETDLHDSLSAYAVATGIVTRSGPTALLKSTLEALCSDAKNTVFVVSGKEMYAVSAFFGDVKGLGLGAEHGFYFRWPVSEESSSPVPFSNASPTNTSSTRQARWQAMQQLNDSDYSWKDPAKKLMQLYADRTHGTYIEQKGNALLWQFRDADPEFGFMQSKELEEHLHELMEGHAVEVMRGGGVSDGYIEIRPKGVSKGLFLKHAMSTLEASGVKVDFLLAVGDDASDEPMFEQIEQLEAHEQQTSLNGLNCFGVSVGKRSTAARSYVDDPSAVMELLTTVVKAASLAKGYSSVGDMSASSDKLETLDNRVSASSFLRTVSVGTINSNSLDFKQRAAPVLGFAEDVKPEDTPGTEFRRTDSMLNISSNLNVYMGSIAVDDDEDDGVYF